MPNTGDADDDNIQDEQQLYEYELVHAKLTSIVEILPDITSCIRVPP